MLFAFVFSACSTSDAFIARSFLNRFPSGSILGFLVYGPMMDIKNLFMLLSLFKKRFVIELTLIITVVNFIGISVLVRLVLWLAEASEKKFPIFLLTFYLKKYIIFAITGA